MQGCITIYTDGASRGNPGPGAAAYILCDEEGNQIAGKGVFLNETTNNIAEYTGLLQGLQAAGRMNATAVNVFSDSELVVRQINGEYRVKNETLKQFYDKIMDLLNDFSQWRVTHILRDKNKAADKLANQALDAQKDVELTPASTGRAEGKHLRLGILLSGGGTTMVNIQKEIDAGTLNAEIAVVISSRSTVKGVERSRKIGIEPVVIRKKDFGDIEAFSNRIIDVLDEAKVDLVLLAGWLCLWQIPDRYENRVMNIHPALLPSFGGKGMWGHHVHEAVLKAGCKVSGCTVHFCNNEYDTGPIIVQRSCPVMEGDDADTLAARVFKQECIAYPEAVRLFSQDRLSVKDGKVNIK